MNEHFDKIVLLACVTGVSVGLSFFPILHVLEILFIAYGLLALVWLVSEVDNRIHLHRTKQKWRSINLERFKNKRPSRFDDWLQHE